MKRNFARAQRHNQSSINHLTKAAPCFVSRITSSDRSIKNNALHHRTENIPLTEHELRQKRRESMEIIEVAVRQGRGTDASIRLALEQMEGLLPGLVNLFKMKASDWVEVLSDVDAVAAKLVVLKTVFPRVNGYNVISKTPKLLLKPTNIFQQDLEWVNQTLLAAGSLDPSATVDLVPEVVDAPTLHRVLLNIRSAMPSQDPLKVIAETPEIAAALTQGEGNVPDSAEYGESGRVLNWP